MTKEEKHLWYDFVRKIRPRFHRQYALGCYIADFYCPTLNLIIEIDGSQHFEDKAVEYDKQRTNFFAEQNIWVMRFTNQDINLRFENVCEGILVEINDGN